MVFLANDSLADRDVVAWLMLGKLASPFEITVVFPEVEGMSQSVLHSG